MDAASIILTCFIGLFIFIGLLSSRTSHYNELHESERIALANSAKEQEDLANQIFYSSATSLLPDSEAALRHLLTRHSWLELIETIWVNNLQLDILKLATNGEITLPNMQAEKYGAEEKRIAKVVHETISDYEDVGYYGVDAFAQAPTTEMLRDLVNSGYVTTTSPITKNNRLFKCELTPTGKALLDLDKRFSKINMSKIRMRVLSEIERRTISDVLYQCIRDTQKIKAN